jgi:(S)-2-hydroxyglutarate dehydrogenase
MKKVYDIAIIGGGIVGAASAMELQMSGKYSVIVLETENELAAHQTGNNSGVIHSGLYYKPGSLKAKNCIAGRGLMYKFCKEYGIAHEQCGKLVVASDENEIEYLNKLYDRGIENGLIGLKKLKEEELKEYEPHVTGKAGLLVPETGIVNYKQVVETYAKLIMESGGEIRTRTKFTGLSKEDDNLVLETNQEPIRAKFLINCGGLHSDHIAKLCGVEPGVMITPFRGEYYTIKKEKQYLVNNLIYPVPDPKYPFLGVHFTRMIKGGVEAGPNALLALKREGYSHTDISIPDLLEMAAYPGFWKMAMQHYMTGIKEYYRSFSKQAFVNSLRKLVPEINAEDIEHGGAGVRAQALDRNGRLLDDFCIVEAAKMVHILNAPSPAATASISIGGTIAGLVQKRFS